MNKLVIETQQGLGDCIYHLAFVRELAYEFEIYLRTPWPEVFKGLPVKFLQPHTILRTQLKNVRRQKIDWAIEPSGAPSLMPKYNSYDLAKGNIIRGLAHHYGVEPRVYDLPRYSNPIDGLDRPICVVRPATVRAEWCSPARNPLAQYLAQAVEIMRETHIIVSVADIDGVYEQAHGELPYADLTLHGGEMDTEALLGLIEAADIVIGGVGFIVPACISAPTKLVCILGGNGGYNAPSRITDSSMNLDGIRFMFPDNYCECTSMHHDCNKTITNFEDKFRELIASF